MRRAVLPAPGQPAAGRAPVQNEEDCPQRQGQGQRYGPDGDQQPPQVGVGGYGQHGQKQDL